MARSSEAQRRLDQRLGRPLLRLIALLRGRRARPVHPRRIGFLEPTAIGDLILDTGLLAAAHAAFPEAELHLFHGASNAALVPLLPVPVIANKCDFSRPRAALAALRAAKLDILVDCTSWPRLTALLSALSGAYTIGFDTPGQSRHHAHDLTVAHSQSRHERDNRAALAKALTGHDGYEVALKLPDAVMPALPLDRLVLCHVAPGGSRAREKSWPAANWAELARRLAADGLVLGFTGVAEDASAIETVLAQAGLPADRAFSLAGRLSFTQLAKAMTQARLLITVYTATVHLGSALGVPMIALHGPSPSRRWGATSAAATSIDAAHPAAGFIHFGFETHTDAADIMPAITVDAVYATAKTKL